MSVSSIGSTPAVQQQSPVSSTSRAADGDYTAKTAGTSQTKDSDGDYKPVSATSSAATTSTSGVQAALSSLQKGG